MAIGANFRSARLCLIGVDGESVDAWGNGCEPRGASRIVIGRSLCRFHLFRAPDGLTGVAAEREERLHAEMRSPFADSDALLLRQPGGIAIWWWDAAALKAVLGDRWRYDPSRILPETSQYPAGDGWRQIAVRDGNEAQYWEAGGLVASAWRRRPFDDEAWTAFAMSVENPVAPPPDTPPPVERLPLPEMVRRPPAIVRRGEGFGFDRIAAGIAVLALAMAGWSYGQALRYEARAADDQAVADAALAALDQDAALARTLGDLSTLRAFAAAAQGPDITDATARAFAFLAERRLAVGDWRIDAERFRATVTTPDETGRVRDVVTMLEEDPRFEAALARSDGPDGGIVIEAGLTR